MSPILVQRTCSQGLTPLTSLLWLSRETTVSGVPESSRWTQTWVTLSWVGRTALPHAPLCSSTSRSWPPSDTSLESSLSCVCLQRSSPSSRFSLMLPGVLLCSETYWVWLLLSTFKNYYGLCKLNIMSCVNITEHKNQTQSDLFSSLGFDTLSVQSSSTLYVMLWCHWSFSWGSCWKTGWHVTQSAPLSSELQP